MKLGDQTYKNHLDGYNQLDLLLGKAPSARHEIFYFGGPKLGAPPMQAPASFNLEAVKREIEEKIKSHESE